jgi:hypothetical protein
VSANIHIIMNYKLGIINFLKIFFSIFETIKQK